MPPSQSSFRSGAFWLLLTGWLVTRGAIIAVWLLVVPHASGDIGYYFDRLHRHLVGGLPAAQTMPEYPTPVLWILIVPYVLGGGHSHGFGTAFVAVMVALDLLFTILLQRRSSSAAWLWVAFGAALGPIIFLRLDLLPALAVAGAIIALAAGRYRASGVLLGLGAGLKVWPATVYPVTFSGQRRRDHLITISFFATGVGLLIAALIYGGWGRLISPVQWQSGRGLQIESIWATVPMLARVFDPAFSVEYSRWQAYEVFGPGVSTWLAVANVLGWAGYLVMVIGYVAWFRRAYPTVFSSRPRLEENPTPLGVDLIALMAVAVITLTLITNKTFSPQYLTWLGAATAVFWMAAGPNSPLRRVARVTGVWVLALAVATQVIYPLGYEALLVHTRWTAAVTVVLAVRNLGLLALGGWLLGQLLPRLLGNRTAVAS
jgi:hypothetical protein